MKQKPGVSIIVPVYNVVKYIDQCIDSLLTQTLSNIEIILIDDCSTDGSYERCFQRSLQDSRIKLLKNDSNIGQGLTRNRGIEEGSGDYVTFVDSDDFVDAHIYQVLLNLAIEYNADIVRCGFSRVDSRDIPEPITFENESIKLLEKEQLKKYADGYFGLMPQQKLIDGPSFSPCTAIYRMDLVQEKGIRFPSERKVRSEDLFFNLAVHSIASRCVLIDKNLYYYYNRPGSTTKLYSSPLSKCLALSELCPDGYDYRLRLTRTFLTSVKEACLQLTEEGSPFFRSVSIIRDLEIALGMKRMLDEYPIEMLPSREKIFARLVKVGRGWPEIMLAYLDRFRRK